MRLRADLLDAKSPAGLEVVQLTDEPAVPACHVYMEAQVFTPDSRRFVLHRDATPHGPNRNSPRHQYLLCDVENDCELTPLTDEPHATSPSVTPDGKWLIYFVDETVLGGGRLILKRARLDRASRETLMVLDTPLPGTAFRPSKIYPLSTISSDGRRVALSAFLGDGRTADAPFGLMVFDLAGPTVRLILDGTSWCNVHPQYCRSREPEASRDILVQENHGCACDAAGEVERLIGGAGADIHVIRDDGTNFRTMPWGRDGEEFCQGHQCWRGRETSAITSTYPAAGPAGCELVEGRPLADAGHLGLATPGADRRVLSAGFPGPAFCHFGTDADGRRLVTDCRTPEPGGSLYVADLPEDAAAPISRWTYLLNPRSSWAKGAHVHPFLSPDGTTAFFNSDESGILQAYMLRGI